jgi:transcriptional regulator
LYNYPQYKEQDREKVLAFMRQYPFIALIGSDANGRVAVTQVPVLLEERDGALFIKGHIAKKSDHHKTFMENPNVLALFTGPHSYVSGSWYSGNPQQASTWNYISIHARGEISFLDEMALIGLLRELSLHFEKGDTGSSTVYDNLPAEYREKLIKAIIPFEIEVKELDNVHKLSQNRDEKSYATIIEKLEQQDEDGRYIAARMRENSLQLFKKE